jgi:hypothetical protein
MSLFSNMSEPIEDNGYKVALSINRYQQFVDEDTRNGNRPRLLENLDMYVGTEHRQWDSDVVAKLHKEGRPALTFNVVQQAVNTVLGNLEQRPTDIKYQSLTSEESESLSALQSLYEYDYERGNFEYAKMICTRDGLIHTGVLKMVVDTSVDYRGNIGLNSIHPSHVIIDPWWQTGDVRDIRDVYQTEWMDAAQIKATYQTKSARIDELIERNKDIISSDFQSLDKVADRSLEWYDQSGNRYRVIERTYMVDVAQTCVISLESGEEDVNKTEQLAKLKGVAATAYKKLHDNDYTFIESTKRVCKILTCCPGIDRDLILEDGEYALQLGCVPYLVFTYTNFYGHRLGLPDLLNDSQRSLNKRESQISHILSQSGNNNYLIESDAFKDPAGIRDFEQRQAKGGQTFEVSPGSNDRNVVKPLERAPIPNDLINATQGAMDMIYRLANVVPAMQGRQEGSQESGIMNEQKTAQSLVALETVSKNRKLCLDQALGDMYFKAAKQLYAGAPREIMDSKNRKIIKINERVWNKEEQRVEIRKDMSQLKRYALDIAETRIGVGRRAMELAKYVQIMPTIKNPVIGALIENQLISIMDVSEEFKTLADRSTKAYVENQLLQMSAGNANAKMAKVQAESAIANGGQPPQPQPPAQGAPPAQG